MRAALTALIAFVAYRVVRIRRAHVEQCVARASLPPATTAGMFRELATSLGELLWVARGWLTAADVVHIPEELIGRIEAARAEGPVMLWCAHTSNWELLAMRAAQRFPLALIVKTQGVGMADRFIQRQRSRAGLRTILPVGAIAQTRASFARGDVVATVIDQVPEARTHGDLVPFLGRPALVDRAPGVLARRGRAHVFVIFASRGQRVNATLAAELTRDVVGQASASELMALATQKLEAHVRAHPASWLWLHRRWRLPSNDRPQPISSSGASRGELKTFLAGQKEVIESTS